MGEQLLVTQALDERDLLVKKITQKIERACFADCIKRNENTVFNARLPKEQFNEETLAAYQQIMDLINRFERIDAAIINSNANTYIETSYGKMSIASAISLRGRLRGKINYGADADFEGALQKKMELDYRRNIQQIETKNQALQQTAEEMRLSILGRDSKVKDDRPLDVVEKYVQENTTELVDPLGILKKISFLKDKYETLIKELDTQIKVSNATTVIEF